MKGKDIDEMEFPDFEDDNSEKPEILNEEKVELENDELFNGSFDFDDIEIPVLEDKVSEISENNSELDDFDFEIESENIISEKEPFENNDNEINASDFDFEDIQEIKEENNFDNAVSEDKDSLDDFEFDFNKEDIAENTKNDFDDFDFEHEISDKVEDEIVDDFLNNEVQEDKPEFEEIISEDSSEIITSDFDDFDFDEVESTIESEIEEFEELDLNSSENLTNNTIESNLDNSNYEELKEEEMVSKKSDDFDDFDFDETENNKELDKEDSFEFDTFDNKSDEDFNDFDFDTSDNDKESDFEFEPISANKEDEFETKFDFDEEPSSNKDNDKEEFEDLKFEEEDEEAHIPRVLKDDENDSTDVKENETQSKNAASKVKIILGLVVVALISIGGLLGFNILNKYADEDPVEEVEEVTPKKQENKVKKEIEEDRLTSSDIAEIDDISSKSTPTRKNIVEETKPEIKIKEEKFSERNSTSNEETIRLNNQLESLIGKMSSISEKVSTVESENNRLRRLVEELKNANRNNSNSNFENFKLEFSNVKSEITLLKEQVSNDKSFNKETMIKFLQIFKKLKEEINTLKSQQVDKSIIEEKLAQIDDLNKQFESLNTKVANNEVINKINNLEKELNIKKLKEVEQQVYKNNQQLEKTVNKKKSVLELLEEKNKEKDMESNSIIVEEDEELKVPLSVTIEDEGDYEKPVVKKQVVKKKVKHTYKFIGTIEGVIYLKNSSGTIAEYRINDHLPGYGEILKIYKDGTIETEEGPVNFK